MALQFPTGIEDGYIYSGVDARGNLIGYWQYDEANNRWVHQELPPEQLAFRAKAPLKMDRLERADGTTVKLSFEMDQLEQNAQINIINVTYSISSEKYILNNSFSNRFQMVKGERYAFVMDPITYANYPISIFTGDRGEIENDPSRTHEIPLGFTYHSPGETAPATMFLSMSSNAINPFQIDTDKRIFIDLVDDVTYK